MAGNTQWRDIMKDANSNNFLNKDVIVQQLDDYCKYGKLVKTELHGIWLATLKETSFITYNNIKTIKLNHNPNYRGVKP